MITYIATMNVRDRHGKEVAIGTLIQQALTVDTQTLASQDALALLRNMGIWPRDEGVLFANKSPPLDRLLKDTPWVSWARPLMDIDGATRVDPVKFATGLKARAVCVPLEAFDL